MVANTEELLDSSGEKLRTYMKHTQSSNVGNVYH